MTSLKDYYPNESRIKHLSLASHPKLIIMSDMHRGDGSGSDDFAHNSLLYNCALDHYFENGFTYVELGDAEELWENKVFDQIYITHTSIYDKIAKFHDQDPEKTRYVKIYGNHDLQWKNSKEMKDRLTTLFPGIGIYEAAVLNKQILLWHGHQADPKCRGAGGTFSKFFVRRFWPVMQKCGFKDPTRAANNPGRSNTIDETLHHWATHNDKGITVIVAGHTHRPVYENLSLTERKCLDSGIRMPGIRETTSDPTYYNTGCCVHPRCITGIEITSDDGETPKFTLIKWAYNSQTKLPPHMAELPDQYHLTVKRTVLEP
jgi:UDP-2,3-diacylglucosamine pyrophosphatase LpxH